MNQEILTTREGWNKLARFYTEFREPGGKFNLEDKARIGEYPYMIELIKLEGLGNKTVLDAGCGYGFYSFIAEHLGAKSVVGIDFSSEMIKLAQEYKKQRGSRVNFLEASVEQVPFKNESFDMVISGMALELKDLNSGIKELGRILKNNGALIFSVPHPVMTHGKHNESNSLVLDSYFTSKEYIAQWHDESGNPVKFTRWNKTFEDYFEALFQSNFVVLRLFESKPAIEYIAETDEAMVTRMMNLPHYLIVLARKQANL